MKLDKADVIKCEGITIEGRFERVLKRRGLENAK
jgi:hypothetical protein